jgi:hypothetical protein
VKESTENGMPIQGVQISYEKNLCQEDYKIKLKAY